MKLIRFKAWTIIKQVFCHWRLKKVVTRETFQKRSLLGILWLKLWVWLL